MGGAFFGFLLSIPAVFLTLTIRFIVLGCGIFRVKRRSFPPKCLVDPDLGVHHYVRVNGVKLHYVESGDPKKPLLLFLHGFPQFWSVICSALSNMSAMKLWRSLLKQWIQLSL